MRTASTSRESFCSLFRFLPLLCSLSCGSALATSAPARGMGPLVSGPGQASGALEPAVRRQVFADIARELRARYIEPSVAEAMIRSLLEHAARRAYDLMDGPALARAVSEDLRAVSHDAHLALDFGPPPAPPRAGPPPHATRGGFGKIERLEGDVAYLEILGFSPADGEGLETIASFMSQVSDARALIVDLRDNRGGRAPTVALMASYFFDDEPVHLSTVVRRYDASSYELWTDPNVKGTRFGGHKPLYLLTSAETFSGAEALAYELQARHRAQVVGETTRGGANPPEARQLAGGFVLIVPVARSISAATQTSWEGVGVAPDVSIRADLARDEAHRRALAEIAASAQRPH